MKAKRDALLTKAEAASGDDFAPRAASPSRVTATTSPIALAADALKSARDRVDVIPLTSLCDATSAVAAPLKFTVVAAVGAAKGKQNPWETAADRAASVARLIEQKCSVPSSRLSATARIANDITGVNVRGR